MERVEIPSLDDFPDFAYAQGWTDGLPVFPPTRDAVQRMIDFSGRDPDEVLGTIFPGDGEATIANVAANCVMAGCLPEYLPVVLAAVECIVDPRLPITTTQSTGSAAPLPPPPRPHPRELGFPTPGGGFGPERARAHP